MAEGFCKAIAAGRVDCRSGGSKPLGYVLPEAIAVMREKRIDIAKSPPRGFDEAWVQGCDRIITMGCGEDACPAFVGKRIEDWDLPDPKGQPLEQFRRVRDEIEWRVRALLQDLGLAPA